MNIDDRERRSQWLAIGGKLNGLKDGGPRFSARTMLVMQAAILKEKEPAAVAKMMALADGLEETMKTAGLYNTKEIRPANEARFIARWKLGQLLEKKERQKVIRGKAGSITKLGKSILKYLDEIGLDKNRAAEVQRIGAIPDEEKLRKAFKEAEDNDILNTVRGMIEFARPWFKIETRKRKHKAVQADAETGDVVGPFTLLYADPPWHFDVFSEKGSGRSADQHYPTLTVDEIANFKIGDQWVREIVHEDAALFLWCTSSNIPAALEVMQEWGFQFKSSAVWVKDKIGTGYIFRNRHELLLYGVRGEMPAPVKAPASVFEYPRGKHSAKPPEIRAELARMYPYFEEAQRLELFARGHVLGWTTFGLESKAQAAE